MSIDVILQSIYDTVSEEWAMLNEFVQLASLILVIFPQTISSTIRQKLFCFEINGSISEHSVELFKAICLSVNKCTVNWIGTDLNSSQVATLLPTSILRSDNPV